MTEYLGKVVALYESGQNLMWSTGGFSINNTHTQRTLAISPSSTTCFDNGGNISAVKTYTLGNSNRVNCGLSFRFIN